MFGQTYLDPTQIQGLIQALTQYGGDPKASIGDQKNPTNIQGMINQLKGPDANLAATGIMQFLQSVKSPAVGQGTPDIYGDTQLTYTGNPVYDTGSGTQPSGASTFQPTTSTTPSSTDQQAAADEKKITDTGATQKQQIEDLASKLYGQNQDFISSDLASRATGRDALAQMLTQQAQQSFQQTLPQTAEDYNSGHLLNSSGYGNEVARQQSNLAAQIASSLGIAGLSDIGYGSTEKAQALAQLQGMNTNALQTGQSFDTAALNRGFSLADFDKQAQLSQQLGALSAPQVGGGKGAAGSVLSGIGSLAPLAGAAFGGPGGAIAGAGLGSLVANTGGDQVAMVNGMPVTRGQTANYSGGK